MKSKKVQLQLYWTKMYATEFEKVLRLLEQKWTLKTYNYLRREIVAVRQREGEDEGNTPSQQYL